MPDPNSPYWPRDINRPESWEKPYDQNPAEVLDGYRTGKFGMNPMPKGAAEETTRFLFNTPALQRNPGSYLMPPAQFQHPKWTPDQYENFMKKTPMSDLGTVSSILKTGFPGTQNNLSQLKPPHDLGDWSLNEHLEHYVDPQASDVPDWARALNRDAMARNDDIERKFWLNKRRWNPPVAGRAPTHIFNEKAI